MPLFTHNLYVPPFRVIHDEAGQTCNRFWAYVNHVAWAVKHHRKVYIIFWDKSIQDYDALRKNEYVSFPFYNRRWIEKYGDEGLQDRIRHYWPRNKIVAKLLYLNKWLDIFHYGWSDRHIDDYYPMMKDDLYPLFLPNLPIREAVDTLFACLHEKNAFIVGVHIRRGDYKRWFNGRFYYEHNQYVKWMKQIVEIYKEKNVYFYLSSNESLPMDLYGQFNICKKTMESASYDLYALSLCDRIIGPTSTFSRWASFMGNVPLCFLRRNMKITSDSSFSPVIDYDHFANGKEIFSLTDFYHRAMRLGIKMSL